MRTGGLRESRTLRPRRLLSRPLPIESTDAGDQIRAIFDHERAQMRDALSGKVSYADHTKCGT